ncbi:RNA processing protein [Ceratobasidium sp. 392]|nr:RNA processing protein [Ceratobasidium sp. 392]
MVWRYLVRVLWMKRTKLNAQGNDYVIQVAKQLSLNHDRDAQNKPMLVELKNGETFNGHLVNCDTFMNITLREVYQTSPEGDHFWKLKECYIRGSMIKYLRVPDALLDTVKEEQLRARDANRGRGGHAPGGGARGGRGAPPRGARGGRGGPMPRGRGRGRGA